MLKKDVKEKKIILRSVAKRILKKIPIAEQDSYSKKIFDKIIESYILPHKNVMIYNSISDEPSLSKILFNNSKINNLAKNLIISLPLINQNEKTISPYQISLNEPNSNIINHIKSQLQKNKIFDLYEPNPNKTIKINKKKLDIVIVPGLVFCKKTFHRLGRGGGYYDKFLPTLSDTCLKIGICFDCQIYQNIKENSSSDLNITVENTLNNHNNPSSSLTIDSFPTQPHDIQLDIIITEKNIYKKT